MQLAALTLGVLAAIFPAAGAEDLHQAILEESLERNIGPATKLFKLGDIDESDVAKSLQSELQELMRTGYGPGSRLGKTRQALTSLYASMPKNSAGKLSRQIVRYALHRFFVQRYGWFIRGLEPIRGSEKDDLTHHGSKDLKEWVPLYLQDLFFEQTRHEEGADLDGLTLLAASLEDIVRLESHERLATVFMLLKLHRQDGLNRTSAERAMSIWFAEFSRQGDAEFRMLAGLDPSVTMNMSREEFISTVPSWDRDFAWVTTWIDRVQSERDGSTFSYNDMKRMVDYTVDNYHAYNSQSNCEDLRAVLHKMESSKPGRIRLATFYEAGRTSQWSFGEKKEYLRTLGVLDESVPNRPYVIIENYVTARSNCFAPSDVFAICCRSMCEELLGHVEEQIGAAAATSSDIAAIVSKLPSATVHAPRRLPTELLSRLSQVAELHGGHIPLHGRLFSQWLHNAYPLECPYPHLEGSTNPQTASEWLNETGQDVRASEEELLRHAAEDGCVADSSGILDCGESSELPWDTTEELYNSIAVGEQESTELMSATPSTSRHRRMRLRACILTFAVSLWIGFQFWRCPREVDAKEKCCMMIQAVKQPHVLLSLLWAVVFGAGLMKDGMVVCIFVFGAVVFGLQQITACSKATCTEGCAMDKLV